MTVTDVNQDLDNLTLTVTAEFDAAVEQVWRLWADPRRLERWWGPPSYPATVTEHDLTPGGTVRYYMTGPDGDRYHGWWRVDAVEAPTSLDFSDGFADTDGKPVTDMPVTTMRMRLSPHDGGTRMELVSAFDTREQMERLHKMGMTEGLRLAMGQQDGLLGT